MATKTNSAEYNRAYYLKNRAKMLSRQHKYYWEHKAERDAYQKQYNHTRLPVLRKARREGKLKRPGNIIAVPVQVRALREENSDAT